MPTPIDELPKIGAPAARALAAAGYQSLRDLFGVERAALARLHGVGPKALHVLEAALEEYDHKLA